MRFFAKTMWTLAAVVGILALNAAIWVPYSARNACADRTGSVGPTWRNEEGARTLVDRAVPHYQLGERHRILVRASAGQALEAMLHLTDAEGPLVRLFSLLRRPAAAPNERLFESLRKTSALVLHERNREWVFATVAERTPLPRLTSARAFRSYRLEPGEAKVAVSVRADPAPHGTWLSTETRLFFSDPRACRAFARYWGVIYPGSALTRLDLLGAAKRRAERRPQLKDSADAALLRYAATALFFSANNPFRRAP